MNKPLRKLLGVMGIGLSWGTVWGAFFVDNSMILILCPLGAVCASASVAIARRAELDEPKRPQILRLIGRSLAKPLQAACASNG